jgi:hypothetical protein
MKSVVAVALGLAFALGACGQHAKTGASGHTRLTVDRTWTFTRFAVDQPPPGFATVVGDWRVQPDPEGGGNVLGQLAPNPASTFNLLLTTDTELTDVDLKTRIRPVRGVTDRGGGLVWRAKDGQNYYVCRWNPLESNFCLYKVLMGERIMLKSMPATNEGGWHEMRAVMRGDRIECSFDGGRPLATTDPDLAGPGQIGFWTKSDAVTLFASLECRIP